MKTREVIAAAAGKLRGAGVPEPENDAWLLFSESFGMSRTDYLLDAEEEFHPAPDRERLFIERLARRQRRIPLQRILGVQNFCGLDLEVQDDVLIPRGDTEILAGEVLAWSEQNPGGSFLDLCTGSGCIAVAVCRFGRFERIAASDLSEAALRAARANAARCGAEITFFQGDLFAPVAGTYDVIAANPPYIGREEIDSLEPEVSRFEPRLALDGGEDGLDFYRRIARQAADYLNPDGSLFLEIGETQAAAVSDLLAQNRFREIQVIPDYAGLDRVVRAMRPDIKTNERNGG